MKSFKRMAVFLVIAIMFMIANQKFDSTFKLTVLCLIEEDFECNAKFDQCSKKVKIKQLAMKVELFALLVK